MASAASKLENYVILFGKLVRVAPAVAEHHVRENWAAVAGDGRCGGCRGWPAATAITQLAPPRVSPRL